MEAGNDISIFPLCVKCNFNNLLKGKKPVSKYNELIAEGGVDKSGNMPVAKRIYEFN